MFILMSIGICLMSVGAGAQVAILLMGVSRNTRRIDFSPVDG